MLTQETIQNVVIDNEDYFVLQRNGSVQVGMKGVASCVFNKDHPMYYEILSLKEDDVEDYFDERLVGEGRILLLAII